jgi:hypothetical protein
MTCCCNLIETLRSTPPSSTSVDDETPWINRLLFRPPPFSCYAFPNVVTLTTSRGSQICAVSLIRPGAAVTLLVSHANAEDLNGVYPTLVKLAVLLNVNVVGYDYSGYGGSTGTCHIPESEARRGGLQIKLRRRDRSSPNSALFRRQERPARPTATPTSIACTRTS